MKRSDSPLMEHSLAELVDALDPDPRATWVHLDKKDPLHALSVVLRNTPRRVNRVGLLEVSPAMFSMLEKGSPYGRGPYKLEGIERLLIFGWPTVANASIDDDYAIKINT